MVKTVKSGGQTGADRTALECARECGIGTGGWVPRGYRTESGIDLTLKDFGLKETPSNDYATRTKWNVRDSDATLWFGNTDSPGYWCTKNATRSYNKLFIENPTPLMVYDLAQMYEILNFAGNRESTNPHVVSLVRAAFAMLKHEE